MKTTAQANLHQVSEYIYARHVAGVNDAATDACLVGQLVYWEQRLRDDAEAERRFDLIWGGGVRGAGRKEGARPWQ